MDPSATMKRNRPFRPPFLLPASRVRGPSTVKSSMSHSRKLEPYMVPIKMSVDVEKEKNTSLSRPDQFKFLYGGRMPKRARRAEGFLIHNRIIPLRTERAFVIQLFAVPDTLRRNLEIVILACSSSAAEWTCWRASRRSTWRQWTCATASTAG